MRRILLMAGILLLPAIMMTSTAPLMAQTPAGPARKAPDSTYVVKQKQDSPERLRCMAKCQEAATKYQADCNKESDPVMRAQCLKMGDSRYRFCTGKCPAK